MQYIPIISTVVSFAFAASVFNRSRQRKGTHLLYWGIGLVFYGLGTLGEVILAFSFSPFVLKLWYLCGAMLTAAWLVATGVMIGLNKPTFESQEGGYLKIWAKPDSRRMYVVAGDPADGTKEGDYSCAQVIDVKNLEQVAVWHGKCDADIFGREMIKLGYWYNTAMLVPERNNMGLATILTMRELDYPNLFIREKIGQISDKLTPELGWVTDMKSKPILIAETQRAIRQKALILHDEATLMELYNYPL